MTYVLGAKSLEKLSHIHPDLSKVVQRAIGKSPVDFTVVEGLRTLARQQELYAQGRTKPGPIVTWTMKSKHIEGRAVDLAPWKDGAIAWNDTAGFNAIAKVMLESAGELSIGLRWGKDWDGDGVTGEKGETDSPHFELHP